MSIAVDVTIEGTSALLQHRFGESAEGDGNDATRTMLVQRGTPREEAEKVAYRASDGGLYHPGTAFGRLLREAGGAHKMKGTRKAAKYIVPAAVLVLDDAVPLLDLQDRPLREFEVDSRPVTTIPATKGRVMRHRPRLDEWRMRFSLRVIESLLPRAFVQQLLTEGGERLGIGDYRPEKGGPFGTFRVIRWEEQTKDLPAAAE